MDWVYFPPVGHAIEGLKLAADWARVNPKLEISVLLHARTATELGTCVPGIARVYPIDLDGFAEPDAARPSLDAVPRDWDYLFADPRRNQPTQHPALSRYYAEARTYFRARVVHDGGTTSFPPRLKRPLRLQLPDTAHDFASAFVSTERSPRISLLLAPGGGLLADPDSGPVARTPPLAFWRTLIEALLQEYPRAEIILLGALQGNRTQSQGVTAEDITTLEAEFPQVRNAYDVGLLNQLALAQRCALHISPHSGFSFAVQCVGTPWLAISGAEMFEYWLNGVPFVSLYPHCDHYPCATWNPRFQSVLPECLDHAKAGGPTRCATAEELTARLPEILMHARTLIAKQRPYLDCVRAHYEALHARLDSSPPEIPLLGHWPEVMTEAYTFNTLDTPAATH